MNESKLTKSAANYLAHGCHRTFKTWENVHVCRKSVKTWKVKGKAPKSGNNFPLVSVLILLVR